MNSEYTFNGIKPANANEVKIWNRYNDAIRGFEWDFVKIRYWPKNLAQDTIRRQLNYTSRWMLFCYFVGNGMDPRHAKKALLEIGGDYFDNDAVRHIESLYKALGTNSGTWQYWDERLKRRRDLNDSLVIQNTSGDRLIYKTAPIEKKVKSPYTEKELFAGLDRKLDNSSKLTPTETMERERMWEREEKLRRKTDELYMTESDDEVDLDWLSESDDVENPFLKFDELD